MRRESRILLLLALQAGITLSTFSQSDRFTYAVTDQVRNGASWTVLRKVDLATGNFSNILLDGGSPMTAMYRSGTSESFRNTYSDTFKLYRPELAFGSGVAAIAYDRRSERIFFTPMYVDQLRYVDLASGKVFVVNNKGFAGAAGSKADAMTTLSRMVIAGDGNGYTLSNDGEHLYKFTTTGTPVITDLGKLTDAALNSTQSIHSFCSNAGGDLIADNSGNLFLITSTNNVFRIGINDRMATFVAHIKGLPDKFTTNGAAVDDGGHVLLSSSVYADAWYTVDPTNWTAKTYNAPGGVYHASDLANSNILFGNPAVASQQPAVNLGGSTMIKLYPNPVENGQFTVRFTNLAPGDYNLQITDQIGQQLLMKKFSVQSSSHTENVHLQHDMAKGVYMVRVTNLKDQQVFIEKLMVTRLK